MWRSRVVTIGCVSFLCGDDEYDEVREWTLYFRLFQGSSAVLFNVRIAYAGNHVVGYVSLDVYYMAG